MARVSRGLAAVSRMKNDSGVVTRMAEPPRIPSPATPSDVRPAAQNADAALGFDAFRRPAQRLCACF
jgi:hypothetical protein